MSCPRCEEYSPKDVVEKMSKHVANHEPMKVVQIPLKLIDPPKHLLREIDGATLTELKESIQKHGVLQPILLNYNPESKRYEIIFGNHRLYAAKHLGLKSIPAIIKQIDLREALLLALVENTQRLELNPFREGEIFYMLIGQPQNSSGQPTLVGSQVFIDKLAKELSKSSYHVVNRLRLFLYLDPCLKNEVGKTLTITNAVQMSRFAHTKQREIFEKIKAARNEGTIVHPFSSSPHHGANYPSNKTPSPYCYCPNCGSQHLKGVSVASSDS